MVKPVEYHPEAKNEIQESTIWYDNKVDGLGLEFLLEVRNAESQICRYPELGQIYEAGTRRYLIKRFPFSVIYHVLPDKIQVVSVAHCKRKPGFWKKRLSIYVKKK